MICLKRYFYCISPTMGGLVRQKFSGLMVCSGKFLSEGGINFLPPKRYRVELMAKIRKATDRQI
jgi:hypothetical protein